MPRPRFRGSCDIHTAGNDIREACLAPVTALEWQRLSGGMSLEPIQMSQTEEERPSVQERLEDIVELLRKHEAAHPSPEEGDDTSRRELVEALVHTLHLAELQKYDLEPAYLGPADYARACREAFAEEKRIVDRLGLHRTSG